MQIQKGYVLLVKYIVCKTLTKIHPVRVQPLSEVEEFEVMPWIYADQLKFSTCDFTLLIAIIKCIYQLDIFKESCVWVKCVSWYPSTGLIDTIYNKVFILYFN